MKKKAFTLQEVLITIGIVGIIAAMTVPSIIKLRPDETKPKYMKAYNALTTLAPEIVGDEALFPTVYNNVTGAVTESGILSWNNINAVAVDPIYYTDGIFTQNILDPNRGPVGAWKFGYLLSKRLNLVEPFTVRNNTGSRFTTSDNVHWDIEAMNAGLTNYNAAIMNVENNPTYRQYITIDTNGNDGPNCSYSNNCLSPDQFLFAVGGYGQVTALDAMGRAYILNPTDMHAQDVDAAKARELNN